MESAAVFEVTHPFHPLHGQKFELLSYGESWGEKRVLFRDGHDRVCTIPMRWTSVEPSDAFVIFARGRSPLHIRDLLILTGLLKGIAAQTAAVCKEDYVKM